MSGSLLADGRPASPLLEHLGQVRGTPCWRVQKALEEAGVSYEIVKGPLRSSKRDEFERISGQRKHPVVELEDGSAYREEKEMAATIKAGGLDEKRSVPTSS